MEIEEPLSGQQPLGCKFCQHLMIDCVICDETEFAWFFGLVSMFAVMFSLRCVVSMCCSMSLDHSAVEFHDLGIQQAVAVFVRWERVGMLKPPSGLERESFFRETGLW